MNHNRNHTSTITDSYVVLADLATRPHNGLTAFSALPDAPVLPVVEQRQRLVPRLRLLAAGGIRGHGRRRLPRPAVAVGTNSAC